MYFILVVIHCGLLRIRESDWLNRHCSLTDRRHRQRLRAMSLENDIIFIFFVAVKHHLNIVIFRLQFFDLVV